jgi:hypothetical protein
MILLRMFWNDFFDEIVLFILHNFYIRTNKMLRLVFIVAQRILLSGTSREVLISVRELWAARGGKNGTIFPWVSF